MTTIKHKPLLRSRVGLLVIHCSATRPSQDYGRAEIDRMHRQRGFFEVGYHYLIRRNGVVEPGRNIERQGAHAAGYNHISVGVCLIGGVEEHDVNAPEDNFTPEQFAALRQLLIELKKNYPGATIVGHGDLPGVKKACPSFSVPEWLLKNPI